MRKSGGKRPVAGDGHDRPAVDDDRTSLELAELRHRTDNLLQTIQSLLHLEAKRAGAAESAERLHDLVRRIDLLAGLHRRLNALGAGEDLDAGEWVRSTAVAVIAPHKERIALDCEVGKLPLDGRRTQSLALLVNEALTNVTRHAFGATGEGRVQVRARKHADGSLVLEILDNGRGLPDPEAALPPGGFGLRLMRALALNLNAEIRLEPGSPGLKLTLRVPPPEPVGTDDSTPGPEVTRKRRPPRTPRPGRSTAPRPTRPTPPWTPGPPPSIP